MWLKDGICDVPGRFSYSWVLVAVKVRRALEAMEELRVIGLTSSWKKGWRGWCRDVSRVVRSRKEFDGLRCYQGEKKKGYARVNSRG